MVIAMFKGVRKVPADFRRLMCSNPLWINWDQCDPPFFGDRTCQAFMAAFEEREWGGDVNLAHGLRGTGSNMVELVR